MNSSVRTKNTGRDYERHIFSIIDRVLTIILGPRKSQVEFTYDARIKGTEGITYQVDILGHNSHELFLIECKDYKGEVDYKVIAAFISKCVDISNQYPDKTVYALVINKSGYHPSAISMKGKKIWLAPEIDFAKQVKLLRIGSGAFKDSIVVYEFEGKDIIYTPLITSEPADFDLDATISYLKTGDDFAMRISKGLHLLSKFDSVLAGKSEGIKHELRALCYEHISNSFLHLKEYLDAHYFSTQIVNLAPHVNDPNRIYESQLISAIATYKRLQLSGKAQIVRPGRLKIVQVNKLIESADNISMTQRASTKLFIGLWLARYEDYELGMKYILDVKDAAYNGNFRDSPWHYFVSLLRIGELDKDKERSTASLLQASNLLNSLCPKHRVVGMEYLTKIRNLRGKSC